MVCLALDWAPEIIRGLVVTQRTVKTGANSGVAKEQGIICKIISNIYQGFAYCQNIIFFLSRYDGLKIIITIFLQL